MNIINSFINIDRSLDLSFNKIRHIENLECLKNLTNLYFVQNKITKVENLGHLTKLINLELGANRIRVIINNRITCIYLLLLLW